MALGARPSGNAAPMAIADDEANRSLARSVGRKCVELAGTRGIAMELQEIGVCMGSNSLPIFRTIRENSIVLCIISIVTMLAWWRLLTGAGTGMSVYAMTTFEFPPPVMPDAPNGWSVQYGLVMLAMWWVMMIAMMLPGFVPSTVKHHAAWRAQRPKAAATVIFAPVLAFVCGYFLVWLGFSIVATALQFVLEWTGALHTSLMWSSNHTMSAAFLVVAGCWQFLGAKHRSLAECRTCQPPQRASLEAGNRQAFILGFKEGWSCLKSCWALMALLFVGGIMNLVWIAGLTLVVLAEKLLPSGPRFVQALGAILIANGLWLASTSVF